MKLFSNFFLWAKNLWPRGVKVRDAVDNSVLPEIYYGSVHFLSSAIDNENVNDKVVYCIYFKNKPRWILFRCPCGCMDVITLSAQYCHEPHWGLSATNEGLPTLYPSVWRDKGCLSHFWIKGGKIFWCEDTGTYPYS